jgi:hypothetical protein
VRKGIKFGIVGAIVIIIGISTFYLVSPLFIATEIDELLPEGVELLHLQVYTLSSSIVDYEGYKIAG